jgi:hypothetical protein
MRHERDHRSIHQLDFERRWLSVKLGGRSHSLTEEHCQQIIGRIETLDFEIAASPAGTNEELVLKVNRLGELIFPTGIENSGETMESVFFSSILLDARRLSKQH